MIALFTVFSICCHIFPKKCLHDFKYIWEDITRNDRHITYELYRKGVDFVLSALKLTLKFLQKTIIHGVGSVFCTEPWQGVGTTECCLYISHKEKQ